MIAACLPVEARVLAEMICSPEALAVCDDVESSDFVDMHHVIVLYGIRKVQQWQAPMTVDTVLDAIEEIAMDWGSPAVAEKVNGRYIAELMRKAPKPDSIDTVRADVVRLRKTRDFRESLR